VIYSGISLDFFSIQTKIKYNQRTSTCVIDLDPPARAGMPKIYVRKLYYMLKKELNEFNMGS